MYPIYITKTILLLSMVLLSKSSVHKCAQLSKLLGTWILALPVLATAGSQCSNQGFYIVGWLYKYMYRESLNSTEFRVNGNPRKLIPT